MPMKNAGFSVYYLTIGVLFIILEDFKLFYPALAVKMLILPALMIFYHNRVKARYNTMHRLILLGLFFSWTGDIFLHLSGRNIELQIDKELFFLIGLGAFTLTYFLYISAFSLKRGPNPIFKRRAYLPVLVMLCGASLIWLIYNDLGDDKIEVIIFLFITLLMLLAALNRHGKVNGVSYMLVAFGAFFFTVAVAMLGIRIYYEKFDFARILIMASYLIAQYLIAMGCIKQDASVSNGGKAK
jgi:uncharacterized membrane protein YhhN